MDFVFVGGLLGLAALTWGLAVLCDRLRERLMSLWNAIGLALAIAVAVYLVWALLRAEEF